MAVTFQRTPNPNAGKFVVGRQVVEGPGSRSYFSAEQAAQEPVAAALFRVSGVASVFMVADFVTVTKNADADWTGLAPAVIEVIEGAYP